MDHSGTACVSDIGMVTAVQYRFQISFHNSSLTDWLK